MAGKPTNSASQHQEISHEKIAERARKLWTERGSPGGRDLEHWLDAERQLRDELGRNPTGAKSAASRPARRDVDEAEKRLDGLIENKPSPARRTPAGEQL